MEGVCHSSVIRKVLVDELLKAGLALLQYMMVQDTAAATPCSHLLTFGGSNPLVSTETAHGICLTVSLHPTNIRFPGARLKLPRTQGAPSQVTEHSPPLSCTQTEYTLKIHLCPVS